MTLILLEDLGLSAKSHLSLLNTDVIIYAISSKVGVHTRLSIDEVFGLTGAVKDWDIGGHTFQYACPMVLTSCIPIVGSFDVVITTKVMVTIVTGVWGCTRVVWRTLIVAKIIIAIHKMTVDSSIGTISSGRVASISGIVSQLLTLVDTVGSMIVKIQSWGRPMGWVIQMSRGDLFVAVISILGPTIVHSVTAIVVKWGTLATRIILMIVVVGVAVVVMTTIRAHGLLGLMILQRGLCNRQCGQRCNRWWCKWHLGYELWL